jgi:chaperone modulatory protein CbpM
MTTALARTSVLSVEAFASAAGLHPELVHRYIRLGLLEVSFDPTGAAMLAPGQLARVDRIQRLRTGLSVNYAALGLVMDLLDRIDNLETAQRRLRANGGTTRRWTPTA